MRLLAIGFAAGCGLLSLQTTLISLSASLLVKATIVAFILFVTLAIIKAAKFDWLIKGGAWFVIGGLCGFIWSTFMASNALSSRLSPNKAVETHRIVGKVCSLPTVKIDRQSFDFCLFPSDVKRKSVSLKNGNDSVTPNEQAMRMVRLHWVTRYSPSSTAKNIPHIRPGELWIFESRLKPPYSMLNDGGFDSERWALINGVDGIGYIKNGRKLSTNNDFDGLPLSFHNQSYTDALWGIEHSLLGSAPVDNIRYSWLAKLSTYHSLDYLGWHKALLFGVRSDLESETVELLKMSGTAHLIAISGLHIGLIFAIGYFVMHWLWRRSAVLCLWINAERIALLSGLTFAIFFSLLAGFSLPTQRAIVALSLFVFSRWFYTGWSMSQLLSITVLIVLLFNPLSILSESFWLSFSALVFIVWFLTQQTRKGWRLWLSLQIYLSLSMAVVSAIILQQWSMSSLFNNLVAIPLVSTIILPIDVASLFLSLLSNALSEWLFLFSEFFIGLLIEWLLLTTEFIPTFTVFRIYSVFLGVGLIVLSLFYVIRSHLIRGLIFLQSILFCTCLFLNNGKIDFVSEEGWMKAIPPTASMDASQRPMTHRLETFEDNSFLKMVVLDVGQGLSVHIQYKDWHLLYDTAFEDEVFSTTERTLMPYLNYHNIDHLDFVVLSHNDNDHSGGVERVLRKYPKSRLFHGEDFQGNPSNCSGTFTIDESLSVRLLKSRFQRGNDASCMVKVVYGEHSILLTGDIEAKAELDLIGKSNGLKSEIILVPHHGSTTSSSWSFLSEVEPKIAVVSAGFASRFGHPNPTIMARYNHLKIPVLNTATSGQIELNLVRNGPILFKQYRSDSQKFWNHPLQSSNSFNAVVN